MVRITVLCDNLVGLPFGVGEHGFSALVEVGAEALLFDTGAGRGIVPNALTFQKDLNIVKKILLSHGHYDHTEGLPQVLQLANGAEIYAHPGVFARRIAEKKIGDRVIKRFIGIPYRREYLESLGARFVMVEDFSEVSEEVFLTGQIPREFPFERGDPDLFLIEGEEKTVDPIWDDQSLVIRTAQGLVVIFGCAHAGMVNTLNYAINRLSEDRILAVLGGTHLGFLGDEQLDASIKALKEMEPKRVAVSHCTGMKAACRLMQEFGERFSFAHVGSVFEFD
jgi:7,8-dihydropterin-6-yl-methyl-4-(beta-D-ribofuranosyl)aminobenzene 5'-phosphate synthase